MLPDVPTFAEAGVPGVVVTGWLGIYGPPGMPNDVRDKLGAADRRGGEGPGDPEEAPRHRLRADRAGRRGVHRPPCGRGEALGRVLREVGLAEIAHDASLAAPVVSLRGVGKLFGTGTLALDGLDLDVRDGEFLSLLGPSGCGKSTALRIIAGLSEPIARQRDLAAIADARRGIGFVFQEPTLMPWATVFGNVFLPLKLAGDKPRRGRAARDGDAGARRPRRIRRRLSARTVRRHADAGVDRARAGHRAAHAADGRAVRGARRDHALQAQRRPGRALARAAA